MATVGSHFAAMHGSVCRYLVWDAPLLSSAEVVRLFASRWEPNRSPGPGLLPSAEVVRLFALFRAIGLRTRRVGLSAPVDDIPTGHPLEAEEAPTSSRCAYRSDS